MGQGTIQPKQMDYNNKGFLYEREMTIDMRLHTNGFYLGANFAKIKTYYRTRYYHIGIGEIKHPKETRNNRDNFSGTRSSRSYIFGKANNLYVIRAGIGEKRYFSEKAKQKGVSIGINWELGPSLGLTKPYYIEVYSDTGSPLEIPTTSIKYDEENASRFLDDSRIFGASGFTTGLSEIRPIPGGHAKFGVHFDWGATDEFVKAFEAGIMVDVFAWEVPLLADVEFAENRPFFINLYLSLELGKRW